jgi:hypothetical protein
MYARQNPVPAQTAGDTAHAPPQPWPQAKQAEQVTRALRTRNEQAKAAKQAELEQQQRDSLDRAENGESMANYPAIYEGFAAKGIPEADIQPRVNVFTYKAWRAKGRQVRRGEKAVKVVTWIPSDDTPKSRAFPKTAFVFHVSQTDPIAA